MVNCSAPASIQSRLCWILSNFAWIEGMLRCWDDSNAPRRSLSVRPWCAWTGFLGCSSTLHRSISILSSPRYTLCDYVFSTMYRIVSQSFRAASPFAGNGLQFEARTFTWRGVALSVPRRLNGFISSSSSCTELSFFGGGGGVYSCAVLGFRLSLLDTQLSEIGNRSQLRCFHSVQKVSWACPGHFWRLFGMDRLVSTVAGFLPLLCVIRRLLLSLHISLPF